MRRILALTTLIAVTVPWVLAERVPLSPELLKQESTHIVTGVVKAIYSRDVEATQYGKGTIETHYLLEIEVSSSQKGQGLSAGDLVYARCWRIKKHGSLGQMPGPSGHFGIPTAGDKIRAYLVKGKYGPTGQSDNGWAVVYPNGIEVLKGK
jgi:hypothetical protein